MGFPMGGRIIHGAGVVVLCVLAVAEAAVITLEGVIRSGLREIPPGLVGDFEKTYLA